MRGVAGSQAPELREGELVHQAASVRRPRDVGVVDHDGVSVRAQSHVELHQGRTEVERRLERRDGVLGMRGRGATVRDDDREGVLRERASGHDGAVALTRGSTGTGGSRGRSRTSACERRTPSDRGRSART